MDWLSIGLTLLVSYILGSIPFGLLIVRIASGKDIREVESGRTGGTNAMRAAGCSAGLFTAVMDFAKGAATFFVVSWLGPDLPIVRVAAAAVAIIGHNYSVFLIERTTHGKYRLRGGAGGATALGGAAALWPWSLPVILPLIAATYYFVGYASVTTISIAVFATIQFVILALLGVTPWEYVLYGIAAMGIVLWALRPNLKRLRDGTERRVGLRKPRETKVPESKA